MDPILSVFPPPLLRLILCGGEGLREAYGPVAPIGSAAPPWTLIHIEGRPVAMYPEWPAMHLTALPALWRLPLDYWRARLALVAAWMLDYRDERWAWVDVRGADGGRIGLSVEGTLIATWEVRDGRGGKALRLPTLPAHLRDHDPAVALVLALYDVPEIRARIAP